jgi:hypothetical protein
MVGPDFGDPYNFSSLFTEFTIVAMMSNDVLCVCDCGFVSIMVTYCIQVFHLVSYRSSKIIQQYNFFTAVLYLKIVHLMLALVYQPFSKRNEDQWNLNYAYAKTGNHKMKMDSNIKVIHLALKQAIY